MIRAAELHPGDIAACYGAGRVSRLISWGTASAWPPNGRLWLGPSHVAVIVPNQTADIAAHALWVESTTLAQRRCLVNGIRSYGPQVHKPGDRIRDYGSGRVDVYRPVPMWSWTLDEATRARQFLVEEIVKQRAVHYDMLGALVSGTRLVRRVWNRLMPHSADVFCSEMLAQFCMRIGRLPLANPEIYSPGRLMRTLVRLGVYRFIGEAKV